MTDNEAVLSTEVLCRQFGGLSAVRDVSLSLRPGELHAVIGPNGAGKSTLVNLLSGDIRPSSGRIRLGGVEVGALPAWRRTQLGIGRSYQRTNIFRALSARENARLAVQALRTPLAASLRSTPRRADITEPAEAALAKVGLGAVGAREAGTLSHGEQRQLEIAMALAGDPRVLLLDEPLAGMGPEESERMAGLLRELSRERAVLLIEHDMDFVFQVSDRMTVMVEGVVLASGLPAEIRTNQQVQRAYLGGHA